jgi:GNAT superfamily N-acetyltransferase
MWAKTGFAWARTPRPFYTENGVLLSNLNMLLIRPATRNDAALLLAMIRELAEFERMPELVTNREEDLARDGFGENPRFRALIAEWSGDVAGYALYFDYYSTWAGAGLFLEDLFVREAFRGRGIGTALLAVVAKVAVEEKCYGIHWSVLNWNEKAIELYKAIGAEFHDNWCPVLLSGEALARLAEKAK